MEIVNIEAVTFSKMEAALEELVGKLQDGNKVDGKYGLEECKWEAFHWYRR